MTTPSHTEQEFRICCRCNLLKSIENFKVLQYKTKNIINRCSVCESKRQAAWRTKNSAYRSNYYKKNKDLERNYQKNWRKSYPDKHCAKEAKRRARKLQATPKWADFEKIGILYEKAKWLESVTGLKYHVDHVIPLNGKNACGFHVWENLQILEATENKKKSNRS